uniref:HAT C-terminal dimerisation domain-containing protein n=1 Tax=Lactuca sativa TaxID=4236 RepID=A0A9R1X9E5_LACSA|nr:hypothetical protein LSAT_V11C500272860 [Lactuca sativa]
MCMVFQETVARQRRDRIAPHSVTPFVWLMRIESPRWVLFMVRLKNQKKEIVDALGGIPDSKLHLTAYLLNPYYHYKDPQLQHDPEVMDAVLEFFDTLFSEDLDMQKQVVTIELPKYKKKMDKFVKACEVNYGDYDPAIWWGTFGGATPHLTKIAIMILSLTNSHEEKNRLDVSKMNNLRKERNMEVLLANDSHTAQEWIVDCDENGVDIVGDCQGTDELGHGSRTRELLDEDFASGSEEEVFEEVDYESDGVQIMEECRDKEIKGPRLDRLVA